MAAPHVFAARSPQDLHDLLAAAPTGWLLTGTGQQAHSVLLPWVPQWDAAGELLALESHLPRGHRVLQALQHAPGEPEGQLLFVAAQAYVSPSWMRDRTQAPTWNSARLHVVARLRVLESPDWVLQHLHTLVGQHEQGRPQAWQLTDMGPRYAHLAQRLVGLRAEPLRVEPVFKLGQDERDDVYADILGPLTDEAPALAGWMRRFNPGRA